VGQSRSRTYAPAGTGFRPSLSKLGLKACDLPVDPREAATVTLPRWWMELITTFRALHDPAEAEYRTHKVLNELIGRAMATEGRS
jgi:hypothetical protein